MQINVKTNIRALTENLNRIQREVIPAAARRAINKTADQVKTAAVREIAEVWGFKQKDVRAALNIKRANFKELVAIITASGKRIPLIKQASTVRQTRQGVVARIGGKARLYPGTYLATMPSGHVGIFRTKGGRRGSLRPTKTGKHVGKMYRPGLPIKELYAPSIPIAFVAHKTQALMKAAIREKFPRLFQHELQFALSRQG